MQITTEKAELTPEFAESLLSNSIQGFHPRGGKTSRFYHDYCRQMRNGEWVDFHPCPLVVDKSGRLIDGHTRCLAVWKTGVAIGVLISYGHDLDVYKTMDIGQQRHIYQVLEYQYGVKNSRNKTAVANFIYAYATDQIGNDTRVMARRGWTANIARNIVDVFGEDIDESAWLLSDSNNLRYSCPPKILRGLYCLFKFGHPEDGPSFVRRVCRSENLDVGSPEHILHSKLSRQALGRNGRRSDLLDQPNIVGVWIRAFNSHLQGNRPKKIPGLVDRRLPRIIKVPPVDVLELISAHDGVEMINHKGCRERTGE